MHLFANFYIKYFQKKKQFTKTLVNTINKIHIIYIFIYIYIYIYKYIYLYIYRIYIYICIYKNISYNHIPTISDMVPEKINV